MATVRFSAELKQQIISVAEGKMLPAIRRASDQRPDHSWGDRVYNVIFREDLPSLTGVPAQWLNTTGVLKLDSVNGEHCGMEFNLSTSRPWPQKFLDTPVARVIGSWDNRLLLQHELFEALAQELRDRNQALRAASDRRIEFVEMVRKVIEAYATLAPAIKAWPPLWDLIPEQVKDRHREVKERASKSVELDVDLNKLTAMSAAAKFGV